MHDIYEASDDLHVIQCNTNRKLLMPLDYSPNETVANLQSEFAECGT